MSNMNYLTLELSQTTDSKVLSSNSSDSEKNNSSLFSDLMEQHESPQRGGNNQIKTGNEEHERLNNKPNSEKAEVLEKNASNNDFSQLSDKEINNVDADQLLNQEETEIENSTNDYDIDVLQVSSIEVDNNNTTVSTEELLSFLNASEKVLSVKQPISTPLSNQSIELVVDNTITDEQVSLKTDKTLIAQSVSQATDTVDSAVLNKANELLRSKTSELPNSQIKKSADLGPVEQNLVDKVGNIEEASVQNKTIENDKLVNNDNLLSGSDKGLGVDEKQRVIPDNNVNNHNPKILINETAADAQLLQKSEVSAESDISQKTVADPLSNEQILAQLKSQNMNPQLNKDVLKTENKTTTVNSSQGINQNITTASKTVEPDLLNTESELDQIIEGSDEAIQLAKDESLNVESKAINSALNHSVNNNSTNNNNVRPNQTVESLSAALSQREENDAADAESYMQDEHSFENVMQTLSADLAQTQKNTITQQAETISIMRKDFTDAVKDKVMVMINQKIQQIDIQLDPPELGSMQVRINMQNEQAAVSFVVQNQQAKEALEQNMERLKQMLTDNGVDVGEANVKQESNQSAMNGEGHQGQGGQSESGEDGTLEGSMNNEQVKVLKASSTGVDYYV